MDNVYRLTNITKLQIAHQIARGMVSNSEFAIYTLYSTAT